VTLPALDLLSDRYRVEREVGRGGMATVYLAQDLKHHRQVAIKVMKTDVAAIVGPDRFLREIEVAARLNHPHIVPLFDSGAAGDLLFYVMPYVAGESLRARLEREGRLPVEDALRLTRDIASALGYAHQHGLVHRDIKPENVLLADGMALVVDFGIVLLRGAGQEADGITLTTSAGAVLGTPQYMSPEQASGREVDGRSDIYSLACVLYEMLAGQPPLVATTADALLRMHVTLEPRPVTDLRPAVPAGVARAIARALAKVPADRFPTAAQFAEALTAPTTGVPTPVPAPQDGRVPPNNIPRPRTRFVGREQQLADCVRLLADTRLLTLTGVGGGGKTRLALKLAEGGLPEYPDGVWFVDLAALSDEDRVPKAVAAALGVREVAGKQLQESLREHVRDTRLLLVLDNCEHLLQAVADLADGLLEAGGAVRILVTSREGLGIQGERLFPVRPLRVPTPAAARDLQAVASSEAVQLFVDRAQRAVHEFTLSEENAEAISDICRRLDGIPLAIELAAARVKLLSVDQIRSRLDDRFRLLTGGSKTALPRHQTLQAAVQWSYDQLSSAEQRLLRVLSVFSGSWTLDTAARVSDHADEFEVLDLLSTLVDKSLVLVDRDQDQTPRYRLLETVRQYAADRLADGNETEHVRQRHTDTFLEMAERAYAERITREGTWSAALEAEHDNLRAALARVRDAEPERYLQLSGALAWFWQARSYLLEGHQHVTSALADSAPLPARSTRARALWSAASLLAWQGDAASSLRLMEEALQMWRELEDLHEVALALEGRGWAQLLGSQEKEARATFEECLRLQRAAGDPHLINRAMVALTQVLVALDEVEQTRTFASEIIRFSQSHGDRRSEHSGWHYLADCALLQGQCADSLDLYRQSLVLAEETGDHLEIGFEVQGIAMSLAGLGDAEAALGLAAAVEAEWERIGASVRVRFWHALLDRYLGQARQTLGETAAARAWSEGRSMLFSNAIGQALEAALCTRARSADRSREA